MNKKAFGLQTRPAATKPSIFDDADDDTVPAEPSRVAATTSATRRMDDRMKQEALEQDPSIYDYDGVYSRIQHARDTVRMQHDGMKHQRDARYIHGMLKQAEERQKQHMRYQDRKIQRELEEELKLDPAVKDAEVFVTDGYKEQQALLKQMEADELRKDELEVQKQGKKSADAKWTGFYGKLLDDTDRMNAAARQVQSIAMDGPENKAEDKTTAPTVSGNDLKGGLNVLKTTKTQRERIKEMQREDGMRALKQAGRSGVHGMDSAARDRLTKEFERQMLEREERERKRVREEAEQLRQAYQRQTDDQQLADARQRAAERRKAKQQRQSNIES